MERAASRVLRVTKTTCLVWYYRLMPEDSRIDVADADEAVRSLVAECEITGRRTVITRGEREVAILISHDEYLAMRETIETAANPALATAIGLAEEQAQRGELLSVDEITGESGGVPEMAGSLERLRFAWRVRDEWTGLDATERGRCRTLFARMDDDPICGVPLYEPARGYWSLRSDSLRLLYRIAPEARTVIVLHLGKAD